MIDTKNYKLVIPDKSYEHQYTNMMDRWESIEDDIQPQLLRRYSDSQGKNVEYSKWLEWCEDDRTTGSMLSTGVPCTLYFFIDDTSEILGAIEINQKNTHRGHLHAGIVPWHRGKGQVGLVPPASSWAARVLLALTWSLRASWGHLLHFPPGRLFSGTISLRVNSRAHLVRARDSCRHNLILFRRMCIILARFSRKF